MKLSRPTIFVLIAIWAAVLLTPPLNLLLRVQLRGSETIRFSALPAPDSIANFWEKAARRFPDGRDILLQAALEYPVDENAPEDDEEYVEEEEFEPAAPPPLAGLIEPVRPEYIPTLNPNLPASQVFSGPLEADPQREKVRRLDLLLKKFPRDPALIAIRLRATLDTFRAERVGGEFSDVNIVSSQPPGYASPERNKQKTNFTPADFQKIVDLCTRGNRIEPDNGFFDWMKCYFLMHAWRDAEAFSALDAAAQKKHYNDYAFDQYRFKVRALSKALDRPLLHEEKSLELFADVSSSASRFREMARILSWTSVKAQRRGDHKQALRITAGLGRTAARIRENSKTYIEGLVARAIESIAWSGPTYDSRARRGSNRRITPNQRIASFGNYATQHGYPELAAEATRNFAAATAFTNAVTANINNNIYGVPFWVYVLADLSWKTQVILLLLLPLALLLPTLMEVLRRWPRVRRVLRLNETTAGEIPLAREVWTGSFACGGLRALGTLFSGAIVFGLCAAALATGAGKSAEIPLFFKGISDTFAAQNGSTNIMQGIYYSLSMIGEPASQWRYVVLLSPLLFGVLFVAWQATQWQKRANGEVSLSAMKLFQSLTESRISRVADQSAEREPFDMGGAVLKLLGFVGMALLIAAWIVLAFIPSNNDAVAWLLPLFFVVLFASALLGEKFLTWRNRAHRLATLRYGLRLLQRSLLTWLVLGSALYFFLLFISLPVRNRADAGVERLLQVGEVRARE